MGKLLSECKNCGSNLVFDPKTGILKCNYCESVYYLPKTKLNAILIRGYSKDFNPNDLNHDLNCYKCKLCGKTYFTSSNEGSSACVNCGSANCEIVKSAGYCADGIIPFEISKDEACEKLLDYLKSKSSVPNELIENVKNKDVVGIYVPVWNFVFDVKGTYSADAVELKQNSSGMYYSVPIPVYGSKLKNVKSADQSASSSETDHFLELFDEKDYNKIIPYSLEYTYGYLVDEIDRDIHEYYEKSIETEKQNLRKSISKYILKKYKDVSNMKIDISANEVYFNFTYVPVYVNTFSYKGKTYKHYVSGTTGKVAGMTPRSIKGVIKQLVKIFGLAVALALIAYFLFK